MASLLIFTLCYYVSDNAGKLTIVGTFDVIHTNTAPVHHPAMGIGIRMRFSQEEQNEYNFQIKFSDEDNIEWLKLLNGKFKVLPPNYGDHSDVNIGINLQNIEFKKLGKYAVELYLDNK